MATICKAVIETSIAPSTMTRSRKALDRLLDHAQDRGWKTFEEFDSALSEIGWLRASGTTSHRACWKHPKRCDVAWVFSASLGTSGILACYPKTIRKQILEILDNTEDLTPFPELMNLREERNP